MFNKFASKASELFGKPIAFSLALGMVIVWFIGGFIFGFGGTYQLIINTTTTIITFLMVFLIQNSQNRHQTRMEDWIKKDWQETQETRRLIKNGIITSKEK